MSPVSTDVPACMCIWAKDGRGGGRRGIGGGGGEERGREKGKGRKEGEGKGRRGEDRGS